MSDAWGLFAAVALAHALGVASPGPDFAVVLRHSLAHGRRAGILTAIGIGCGIVVQVSWGLFGLAWAVERLPLLLPLLRYGGALFLLWMGLDALRSRPAMARSTDASAASAALPPRPSAGRLVLTGMATNLLNPKAVLFFIALFSGLITSDTSIGLRLLLGLWLVLATVAWFSLLATTVGHPVLRHRLAVNAWRIDRAMGLILVLLAVVAVLPG